MHIQNDKIDNATLALLTLTLHDKNRAWKQHDWEAINRLYEKGLIYDPKNKTKSIALTDEGLEKSQALFKELFTDVSNKA